MKKISIQDNKVSGWITKQRGQTWSKWTRFIQIISFGLIKRKKKNKEFSPQKMLQLVLKKN